MASVVQTIVTETSDKAAKTAGDMEPHDSPEEHPEQNKVILEDKPRRKIRSKYRHVAAPHADVRPSCLSHESKETPSFLGFRNLMVLIIIVMNLRLVIENARKYGLLITLKFNVQSADIWIASALYIITPVFLFIAYRVEVKAMDQVKIAVGKRKKSDASLKTPETEKERKEFYNMWWWIATWHTLNATAALLIASCVVFYSIQNPGLGCICELHAIVVWLKTCSYAFTNRDLRHAMLHPGGPESDLPPLYTKCPYPQNITLGNLCYFWWAPTLVYQPYYPRTPAIRWPFFFKRCGETLALSIFIWFACAQYAEPVLRNSLGKMAIFDLLSILERLMKLGPISLIVWLAGFFALFQSFLNALAEIMRFGDRQFYEDWWNATSLKEYWSTWNKPVYHFMRRHIYSPLVGRGWSHSAASIFVFVFSGFLHELVVGVPAHSILGVAFAGMMLQLPLIFLTEWVGKLPGGWGKVFGNGLFWVSFVIVGQPLAAMIYFYSWHNKYGSLSQVQTLPEGNLTGTLLGNG
jgi:diacylglycerol O-acyltransferase 1